MESTATEANTPSSLTLNCVVTGMQTTLSGTCIEANGPILFSNAPSQPAECISGSYSMTLGSDYSDNTITAMQGSGGQAQATCH